MMEEHFASKLKIDETTFHVRRANIRRRVRKAEDSPGLRISVAHNRSEASNCPGNSWRDRLVP